MKSVCPSHPRERERDAAADHRGVLLQSLLWSRSGMVPALPSSILSGPFLSPFDLIIALLFLLPRRTPNRPSVRPTVVSSLPSLSLPLLPLQYHIGRRILVATSNPLVGCASLRGYSVEQRAGIPSPSSRGLPARGRAAARERSPVGRGDFLLFSSTVNLPFGYVCRTSDAPAR